MTHTPTLPNGFFTDRKVYERRTPDQLVAAALAGLYRRLAPTPGDAVLKELAEEGK